MDTYEICELNLNFLKLLNTHAIILQLYKTYIGQRPVLTFYLDNCVNETLRTLAALSSVSAHSLNTKHVYKHICSFSGKESLKVKPQMKPPYTNKKSSTTYIYNTSIFNSTIWSNKTSYWKSWITVFLSIFHIITPGYRHVIDNPRQKSSKNTSSERDAPLFTVTFYIHVVHTLSFSAYKMHNRDTTITHKEESNHLKYR